MLLLLIRHEAQYVVFWEIVGVVKLDPVPTWLPANWASYHLMFEQPEAVNVTVPVLHSAAPVVVGGAGGVPVTVNTSILL